MVALSFDKTIEEASLSVMWLFVCLSDDKKLNSQKKGDNGDADDNGITDPLKNSSQESLIKITNNKILLSSLKHARILFLFPF
jgi:hypothetical protein